MRRTLLVLLAPVLLVVPPAFADERGDEPPPLEATLAACGAGPTADERFAVFTASMPAYRGTTRLAMRFDLLVRRSPRSRWRRVRARGFGDWERSEPGRAGFVFTKRVERLPAGADYRAVVRFRWYQSGGERRRDRVRRTGVCRQPDQRPNLRIDSVEVRPGPDAATSQYTLVVVNAGRTAADAFDVALAVGEAVVERSVPGLPPGERATLEVVGPRCGAGDRVRARADVSRDVEESDERDNAFSAPCDGR